MCDYSLHNVKSRPAKVGDKLTTHHFNTGTRGFAAPEDANTAVCVLPGTELAFAREVSCRPRSVLGWKASTVHHTTAIFRQINKDDPRTHHDALEFPNGQIVLLTDLFEDQEATVLQLPAQPATAAEAAARDHLLHPDPAKRSNSFFFFFVFVNGPADPELYTLSLHDALPESSLVSV